MSSVHIKEDPQDSLLLETLIAIGLSIDSITVSQLASGIVGPPKAIVTKGCLQVKFSALADADFKLIFGSCIWDDLPVMDALVETLVSYNCPEQILLFLQEN